MKIAYKTILTLGLSLMLSLSICSQQYTESALGFDPGEFDLVPSPYPDDLRPLYIPRFRGLLRLGTANSYGLAAKPIPQDVYRSQKERRDLLTKKKQSILRLFELLEIEHRSTDIKVDELAKEFVPTIGAKAALDDPIRTTMYWSGQFKELAPKILTPKALSKYWCAEGENCIPETGGAYVPVKKGRPTWGGRGSDEFARLRAWQAYVKTEVPKMKTWAKQIDVKEAYFVGTTYITEYDFNHEGFVLRVDAIQTKALKSSLLSYTKIREEDSFFARTQIDGRHLAGRLIKMSPEKAEKLVETMAAHDPRNRQMYYVYKASISAGQAEGPQGAYGAATTQLFQEPSSNIIEFFLDDELKIKLFEYDFTK